MNVTFEDIKSACFNHIIGQTQAVRQLIQSVMAVINGHGDLFSGLLLAPAGTGKTALLKAYGAALVEFCQIPSLVVTPQEFRRLGDSWNELLKLLDGGRYFLAIDECHELYTGKTVQTAKIASFAMRALDGNYKGGGIKLSDELIVDFSRKHCSIMLATNFPGKLPEALGGTSGRAERLELALYSEDELKRILLNMLGAKKIRACEESLGIVARCGRGTARPLEHVTRKLDTNLLAEGDKRTVNKADIFTALKDCQMFPLGYARSEIDVLLGLENTAMTQQVVLARFPKLDLPSWRQFVGYAMGNCHVGKANGGFVVADKGRKYLEALRKEGFI